MDRYGELLILNKDEERVTGLTSPVPVGQAPSHLALLRRTLQARRMMIANPDRFGLAGEAFADTQAEADALETFLAALAEVAHEVDLQVAQVGDEAERFLQSGPAT